MTQSSETTLSELHPPADWITAKVICENNGQTLLTIPTQAKEDAIAPYVTNVT